MNDNLYAMSETCNGMDIMFPIPEDFQIRMSDLLFIMKYHGHYSFEEVMNLPVAYRAKHIEMLLKQLQKESGSNVEYHNAELNPAQEKEIQKKDYRKLAEEAWLDMMKKAGGTAPTDAVKMPGMATKKQEPAPQKMKSPF